MTDKGKGKMTAEQELADLKAKKAAAIRHSTQSDILKLQPPPLPKSKESDLGLSEEEIMAAKALQIERDLLREEKLKEFNDTFHRRCHPYKIIDAHVIGHQKSGAKTPLVKLKITRENLNLKVEDIHWLNIYGYTEWLEILDAIRDSKSKYKPEVTNRIQHLLEVVSGLKREFGFVTPPVFEKSFQTYTRSAPNDSSDSPSVPLKIPVDEVFIRQLALSGRLPVTTNLDLSLPPGNPMPHGTVLYSPEAGMYFYDVFGDLRFQRSKELPIADTQHLHTLIHFAPNNEFGRAFADGVRAVLQNRTSHQGSGPIKFEDIVFEE